MFVMVLMLAVVFVVLVVLVLLAGELLPGAAGGELPSGLLGGVNSGKKKSPCRR